MVVLSPSDKSSPSHHRVVVWVAVSRRLSPEATASSFHHQHSVDPVPQIPIQKAQIGLVLIDIHHTKHVHVTHYTTHMLHACILCVLHVWTYFICTYNPGHQQAGHWLFQSSTLLIWLCIDEPCLPQWTDGIRFWEAIPNSLSYQHSIPPLGVRRAAD